jgi:hypothetical protein
MNEPISPEDREGHFVAKAEGDSDPALSRFGAGERQHMERMLQHALDWIAENWSRDPTVREDFTR